MLLPGTGLVILLVRNAAGLMDEMGSRRRIRLLVSSLGTIPDGEVYKILAGEIKKTVERERGISCHHLSTPEIIPYVEEPIVSVLARGDTVRFGGREVEEAQLVSDIRQAEYFVRAAGGKHADF